MTNTRELVVHALRTIALSLGLAFVLLLVVYLLIRFGSDLFAAGAAALLLIVMLLAAVLVVAVLLGRRHAGWAPVFDTLDEVHWSDEHGEAMATAVERAKIDAATCSGADAVRSRVLRVSVYRARDRQRRKRVAVGDIARYLGRYGDRLWFLVNDRYHSGRIGLVGYDVEKLDVTFHLPGLFELAAGTERSGPLVRLDGPDGRIAVDLRRPSTAAPGRPSATSSASRRARK